MSRVTRTIQNQLVNFENACREAGLRLTHQRKMIFIELARSTDHPSAEALYQRLRHRISNISLDTVYRTLTTLAHHHLIQKVETVESQARYEVIFMQHHHLICSECKEVMDFQWHVIDIVELPDNAKSWGRIDNKNVVVYGVCSKCLERKTGQ